MQKEIVYETIPEFDQQTQAVCQLEPVDMGAYIYYGVEICEIDNENEDFTEEMG